MADLKEDEHGKVLPVEPYIADAQPVSVVDHDAVVAMAGGAIQGDPFIETEDETDSFDVTKDWGFSYPDPDLQLGIQKSLAEAGLYSGKQNGKWGNLSIYAIQEAVKDVAPEGWFYRIKGGEPDASLCFYIKKYSAVKGVYTPIEDHYILSDEDWAAFLVALEG